MAGEAPKKITVLGLTHKVETTYNTYSAPATTDGFQLAYDQFEGAPFQYTEDFDGMRGLGMASTGYLRQFQPSARVVSGTLPHHARGGGAAYSAGVVPSLHSFLKACGLTATVTTTGGSEKWTYTITSGPTGFSSLSMDLYARGEKWSVRGAMAGWAFGSDSPAPPKHEFTVIGLLESEIADSAVPSITYPLLAVEPAKSEGVSLTLGSWVPGSTGPIVRSYRFEMGRQYDARRQDLAVSGGHAGFASAGRTPKLIVTVEACALVGSPFHTSAGIDPYKLRLNATVIGVILQVGSTQYNRMKLNMPQAQIVKVTPSSDGPVATWELEIVPHVSTPIIDDDFNVVFD